MITISKEKVIYVMVIVTVPLNGVLIMAARMTLIVMLNVVVRVGLDMVENVIEVVVVTTVVMVQDLVANLGHVNLLVVILVSKEQMICAILMKTVLLNGV